MLNKTIYIKQNALINNQIPYFLSFLSRYFLRKSWLINSLIQHLFYGFFYKQENKKLLPYFDISTYEGIFI